MTRTVNINMQRSTQKHSCGSGCLLDHTLTHQAKTKTKQFLFPLYHSDLQFRSNLVIYNLQSRPVRWKYNDPSKGCFRVEKWNISILIRFTVHPRSLSVRSQMRKCTQSSLDLSSFNSLQKQSYTDSVAKIQASVRGHHSRHSPDVSAPSSGAS